MNFITPINITPSSWQINPAQKLLFVGSCFASNIGTRFQEEMFPTTINPYGVMYNPVSILHTITRLADAHKLQADVVILTLGTNHVYRLIASGEIVDNCEKRPQKLFQEEELTINESYDTLAQAINLIHLNSPSAHVIVTVSPIRYKKYGFHESQLSKATLLLATDQLVKQGKADYFPAYEIMNDELRDYRFYAEDMIHPSQQAVTYIWERFAETYFSTDTIRYLEEWKPIKAAFHHKPFNPEGAAYQQFIQQATIQKEHFLKRWNIPMEDLNS